MRFKYDKSIIKIFNKMVLFKKKCQYCGIKIEKDKEVFAEVKVPEFKNKIIKPFCSDEHAELYKKCVKGTLSSNSCPFCRT